MSILTISNSPSKQAAYTNMVYMEPGDFRGYKSRSPDQGLGSDSKLLVFLRSSSGDWVFTATSDAKASPGTLGVSGLQRRTAQLELGQKVEVEAFLPTPAMALQALRVTVASMGKSPLELDAVQLGDYFKKEYLSQVFAPGQKLAIAFRRTALEATVEGLDLSEIGGGKKSRFGQVLGPSRVVFRAVPGGTLTLRNAEGGMRKPDLFNSDFDFGKLGIGGLQSEFNTIFRRAFASRIYPSHIIKQMGITHVRGMLLHGPPGCGKTLIARQIGKVLNAREPKIVNGPEILDKYVGASEEKIRELFADAETEQKRSGDDSMLHIIIFDEMDAIMKQRGSSRDGTGVQDSIVNQLLAKIDGVDSLNNILIIGMTNRKDMIDEAILRPGRLELHVEIGLPDEKGRLQILDIKTANMRDSGRLTKEAQSALPDLANKTKNFSGAELEGLVKAAASYALRRCVDVSKGMSLDEDSLKVTDDDFNTALDSGEVQPAFGVNVDSLEMLYKNGIVNYGQTFLDIDESLDRLVDQVRNSPKTPLMTVLLDGPPASGKTALAASKAVSSKYPFIRLLSADKVIGYSESAKCTYIHKFFMDSYKSALSLLVIDDIERLIEYSPIGPRFSNTVLQTLLVLLKKAPPEDERRLLVICTTALSRQTLRNLELFDAFNVPLHVPKLSSPTEIAAVLADQAPTMTPHDVEKLAGAITEPIGVKQLLMVTEMAKSGGASSTANASEADFTVLPGAIDYSQFLFCLHTVVDDI